MSASFLKEMSWTTFAERKKHTDLVIIPAGACEVYGPHLPLGSDSFVAVQIAKRVADQVNAIIGPTLEVGDSSMLDEFPGTITIRPESFKAYLNDVIDSLLKWGFKDFLFVNAHAGNVPIIAQLSYSLRERSDIRKAQIDYWRFLKSVDQGVLESGETAHSHAGEAGTSVMMYLHPELVDTSKTMKVERKLKDSFPDIMKYGKLSANSEWGTVGDSTIASAEKGKLLVDRSVERIVQFLEHQWGISRISGV
ncbi:creatininase family protein [Paenibacillus hamazuiensis]|uniref:creatininase family protein n=1 Tax=Paenibacillus hamazuiensis TaxID=2936508 RepID=UPI00200F8409|nr:creatininase family protein [Paenibacillus hamazuiensis]